MGDSTNDQLMFEHFPHSVGVANLMRFAEQLHGVAGLDHAGGARPRLRGAECAAAGCARPMSDTARDTFVTAAALALGAAISLGLARFSYALLLPPMRADLGWSYFTAGAMNTVNAAGYLVGALLLPRALARFDARTLLLAGGFGTALVLAAHGLARSDMALYALRGLAGVCSAATFATGGLLAARLGQAPGAKPALVLGLYYGGTGLGIIASALIVPPLRVAGGLGGAGRGGTARQRGDGARHTLAGRGARGRAGARRRLPRA